MNKMEKNNLRIDGIYDFRTVHFLEQKMVQNYSLDFRTRSFNFLQQHKFFELLGKDIKKDNRYFLHYAYEKDFIISKMIDDLRYELGIGDNENEQKE